MHVLLFTLNYGGWLNTRAGWWEMPCFMFDTNIFSKILKMKTPEALLNGGRQYFVTHIQQDELEGAPKRLRDQLLSVFQIIPQQPIPTETAIFDVSRFGMAKFGDGDLYTTILQQLDRAKPMEHSNNIKDAIIAETAIKNQIVLVTNDKTMANTVQKLGGQVMSFESTQGI